MSIFPQFIDLNQEYSPQFILLAVTFSVLSVCIYSVYAATASLAKTKLSSQKGHAVLSKVSGSVFVGFGVGLAASSR